MNELNASLYMMKGIILDSPVETRQKVISTYNKIVDVVMKSEHTEETILAFALISPILADKNFDWKLDKLDENLQPIKIKE